MKQIKILFLISIVLFLLTSCLKEEIPIEAMERGDALVTQVEMGSNYARQIWFDLGSNTVKGISEKKAWDIAFDCDENENWIYLNSSLVAKVARTNSTDIHLVNEATANEVEFYFDHHTGSIDSLAIGDWTTHNNVYILDRGYDESGNALGMIKIQFLEIQDGVYSFQYTELDGSEIIQATVTKNDVYNVMGFSFATQEELITEPPRNEWDICFTQYTHIFYDPYTPYLVTGVLINPYMVEVAETDSLSFVQVTADNYSSLDYYREWDIIGYDWKYYDFDAGTFLVNPEHIYTVRDTEGFYYKLHFLDFYDDQGEKGAPLFEFQKL